MPESAGETRSAPNVIPMTDAHLDRVCDIMARSFHDEPVMRYTLPDADRRPDQIRWLFGKCAQYAIRHGRAYTTDDVRGFSVWLAPGDPDMRITRLLQLGIAAAPLKLGLASLARFMKFSRVKDRLHHKTAPGPHWYLLMIGVDPDKQGGGLGRALVNPVLEEADKANLPCYLETAVEQNTKIFSKYGFTTAAEADVLPGELHLWGMTREGR